MYAAIVFLPLLGSLIAGLLGRVIGALASQVITTILLFISAALSIVVFANVGLSGGATLTVPLFEWIHSGTFMVDWTVRVDTITAVMLVVVTGVSSLVHLYSIGYMSEDPGKQRFFSYLSLFTFAMLMLVTSNNFLQLFFGWEGVGLSSYLLIGFWYHKPTANAAAIKAFVVNRVGDFCFALGIFGIWMVFHTLDFEAVFAAAPAIAGKTFVFAGHNVDILTTLCLLLFGGAMGKSAQFGLHTWLPDAMEGPTPVSALIHAATMVTAGVFLVCRCSPMFSHAPAALEVVAVIGAITAFFGASAGLFLNDIKKVIAYSTVSQLGYMFAAAGMGAYGIAMFHLFTHAFFKALLFLTAGSVIRAVHHEQDMRRMGGLARRLPVTWTTMLIGNLALTAVGLPLLGVGFAGFYSKDAIINSTFLTGTSVGSFAFTLLLVAAGMTSFYAWRQFLLTFHGRYRGLDDHSGDDADGIEHWHHPVKLEDVHESPSVMLIPLIVLAAGATFAGAIFASTFIGEGAQAFWRISIVLTGGAEGHLPLWVEFGPLAFTLVGFLIAYYYYILHPALAAALKARQNPLYLFLYNKWYIDELYDILFVRTAFRLGRFLWKRGDGTVIDGLGPDGISARILDATRGAVKLQTGYVYHYALAMLLGVVVLTTWFVLQMGGTP